MKRITENIDKTMKIDQDLFESIVNGLETKGATMNIVRDQVKDGNKPNRLINVEHIEFID